MADATKPGAKKKVMVTKMVNGIATQVEMEVDDTGGPEWGANDKHRLLNQHVARVDGPVKVCGAAKYTYDMRPEGMLFGAVLRSPHARAKVKKVDVSGALSIKGVMGAEVLPYFSEVMYEGQPFAAVAAVTPEIAEDGLRAIKVDYEVLPFVVTREAALAPGAPRVYPNDGKVVDNVRMGEKRGNKEKTDAALKAADVSVEVEYSTPRIHHCCLETHGIVADYTGGDTATVYASTQGVFTIAPDAARPLGLKVSNITAVTQHMGGGFGSKFGIGVEGNLACLLSKKLKAPVRMMLSREDEFLMAGNRGGSFMRVRAGASKEGKLVAMDAYQQRLGGVANGSQAGLPYGYAGRQTEIYREIMAVHTNEDASRAMRAPGHPETSFVMESIMDELAFKLDMDPLEFRFKCGVGGDHERQLKRAAKEIGWAEKRNKTPGKLPGPLVRGTGCAVGGWFGAGRPQCVVTVAVNKDGTVQVSVGSQDLGTGTRTYLRAIVAEELGLQMDDVMEKIGNSKLGNANSSGGSTTAPSLSPAVKDAAYNMRLMMAERLAPVMKAKPADVTFTEAGVTANGQTLKWKQACNALPAAGLTATGVWKPGLSGHSVGGACCAEVEVDIETGHVQPIKMVHVQDTGLPLNRTTLESQINGGMIQGLGMALFEGRVMDEGLGVMLNPGLGDYKLPGCLEMPEMVPIVDDGDTRPQVIGSAEAMIIPAVGALANAVFNACGARVRDLPITADKVLMALSKL